MRKTKKIPIILGAVLLLVLTASALVLWKKNNASEGESQDSGIAEESEKQETPLESETEPTSKNSQTGKGESAGQANPDNGRIKSSVFLEGKLNLTQEVKIEQEVFPIYENTFLTLDQAALDQMMDNLENNQWGSNEYKILGEGSYLIASGGQGSVIADQDKVLETAQRFLQESGLSGILKENEMEYEWELTGDSQLYTVFCYFLCDNERTGSYIRMNLEGGKICAECMMYLYQSEKIEQLNRVPIEKALAQAFYIGEETGGADQEEYNIQEVSLKYVNGLPFYHFLAYGVNNRKAVRGFALAVSLEESEKKAELTKKYSDFTYSP